MPLCPPRCFPRPTYPTECPFARIPEATICCLSSSATLSCDPSGSEAVSWSEDRSAECETRPLGTNLNGVMSSEWFAADAMAAYTCLFGGILPGTLQARLGTQWTYDCNTGLVMFSCYLEIAAIGGTAGNRYHFARSTVDPDWYLSAPITVTCADLDSELVQTVACAETTVSLTCAVGPPPCEPYLCFPLCVVNTCAEDPEVINASAVFITAVNGTTEYTGTATWSDVDSRYSFSLDVGPDCGTLTGTIECDGAGIKVYFDLFDGTTHTLAEFSVTWECLDGDVSWTTPDPVSGITCSLMITLWTNNNGA